eukprot:1098877-Pleurochrysis_carterae.AAC.1
MSDLIAGEHIYEQHHVCSSTFGPPQTQRRRSQNSNTCLCQQDRLGFHTFRQRGNRKGSQVSDSLRSARKNLFLGLWTGWQRVHVSSAASVVMNRENNSTVKTVSAADYTSMIK